MRRSGPRVLSDAYRLWMSILGWSGFAAICIVWGIVIVPPTLLLHRFRPGVRERFGALTRSLLRLYLRSLLFLRFEVEGIEGRLRGPRIVVANHQSFLDPILMIGLEPGLGGPIRSYIYRVPILRTIVRLAGFYPFDVGELPSLEQLHHSAEEVRERGGGLLFFPEGTRTRTGEVGPFHRGAFRIAVDHELPLQPVAIEGLDRVLPPGKLLAQQSRRFLVRVRYLEPIEPPYGDGARREVVRALAERIRTLLVDELERMRSERREDPKRKTRAV